MKAELYYTLSRKYSIAKLRSFDNGTIAISISFMGCIWYLKSKKGAIIMSIFIEIKEYVTARQVAEAYGLQVRKNGLACCPFHDDRHTSMEIDRNYHCFACGVGGDAIDYVSRMFSLSQYEAALEPNSVVWYPLSTLHLWCGTESLFSAPSPIANDGVLCRSEQSVGELLRNRLCRL